MDEKTAALIEKLAEKLGTTAEHLWGVIITQAQISGLVDLIICTVLVALAVVAVRFVKHKTTKPEETDDDRYQHAEWEDEGAGLAWLGVAILLLIVGLVVIGSAQDIVAAFANPEYWALKRVLP